MKVKIAVVVGEVRRGEDWDIRKVFMNKGLRVKPRIFILLEDNIKIPEKLREKVAFGIWEVKEIVYHRTIRKILEEKIKDLEKYMKNPPLNTVAPQLRRLDFYLKIAKRYPDLYNKFYTIKKELEQYYSISKNKENKISHILGKLEEKAKNNSLTETDLNILLQIKREVEEKKKVYETLLEKTQRLLYATS